MDDDLENEVSESGGHVSGESDEVEEDDEEELKGKKKGGKGSKK